MSHDPRDLTPHQTMREDVRPSAINQQDGRYLLLERSGDIFLERIPSAGSGIRSPSRY